MRIGRFDVTKVSRLAIAAMFGALASCQAASAQDKSSAPAEAPLSSSYRFTEASGEQLFAGVCQGCHMPDGKGASGAGSYPSLVEDTNLETKGYPVYIVVRGQRAMPPVGDERTGASL